MSAVVIDGGLVHYEAFGRGLPVLFLHGWLGSWRYWMSTMEAISDKNRTYAVDLWGFGDSDKSKERYTVADYVALVDKFIENRGVGEVPVTIIGHALGAVVALAYVAQYPERVNKLMTISLPMQPENIDRKVFENNNSSVVSKMMWWRQQTPHKEVQSEMEKTAAGAITASLASLNQVDPHELIRHIAENGKVLLAVYGEKDDVVDPIPLQTLDNRWPNVRPIGLSESKHFPMLEEATKFQRLLKDFLEVTDDLTTLELKEEWRRRTR